LKSLSWPHGCVGILLIIVRTAVRESDSLALIQNVYRRGVGTADRDFDCGNRWKS
jgi:hypothetical protein